MNLKFNLRLIEGYRSQSQKTISDIDLLIICLRSFKVLDSIIPNNLTVYKYGKFMPKFKYNVVLRLYFLTFSRFQAIFSALYFGKIYKVSEEAE